MANKDHLEILKQGAEAWNKWRKENPETRPDISGANFKGASLSSFNLSESNLISVNFIGVNLSNADLRRVNLSNADLERANLSRVNLRGANLRGANLNGVNLSNVRVGYTTFGDNDLSKVKGFDSVYHIGPSTIGIDTIYKSKGQIPESFLRGCGVPDNFITYMASLTGKAFEYHSCFISYSSKNEAFAKRLHADLQSEGVRCWFAPEDMKIGDEIRQRIDESIRLHDKLLLILSEESIASAWVKDEVESAFERERRENRLVLFPVRIDDSIESSTQAWAASLRRTRHIGDFEKWKEHDAYQKALARLLRDLKAEDRTAG